MSRALRDLLRHAPRGRAWAHDASSVFVSKIATAAAASLDRVEETVADFLLQTLPSTATDHIDRWESALGLTPPDYPFAAPEVLLKSRQLFAQSVIRKAPLSPNEIDRILALFTSDPFDPRIYRRLGINKSVPHEATITVGSSDATMNPFLLALLESFAPVGGAVNVSTIALAEPFAGITAPADGYVHVGGGTIAMSGTYGDFVDAVSIIFDATGATLATAVLDGVGGWTATVGPFSAGSSPVLFPRAFEFNPGGSFVGDGASVTYSIGEAPSISGVPTIDNTSPSVGELLTATAAAVTGTPPPANSWQWMRGAAEIVGANSITYTTVLADVGSPLSVVQTAANSSGFDMAESAPTDAVLAGGSPLAISGTEREDETLTASGGTAPYEWTLVSDGTVLGSSATLVIPASAVGETIRLTDDVAATEDTGVIGSSALGWFAAGDYTGLGALNRGTAGYLARVPAPGVAPAQGVDTLGDYLDFAGAGGLSSGVAHTVSTSGNYTVYILADAQASAVGNEFYGELYEASKRLSFGQNGTAERVLSNGTYTTLGTAVGDACTLQCIQLNGGGGVGTAERRGYHDAITTPTPPAVTTQTHASIRWAIGGLYSGINSYQGKLRFFAIYDGIHDATKRAEVRAALKRTWAHVDQTALEIRGLRSLCNAESGNVTERISGPDTFAVTAADLSGHSNDYTNADTAEQPKIETDPGGRWNGKRVLVSDGIDDVLIKSAFDMGGSSDEMTMGMAFEFVAGSSGARFFGYNELSGMPRWFESGSSGIPVGQNGTDSVVISSAIGNDAPIFCATTYESSVAYRGFNGGRMNAEVAPCVTRTLTDLHEMSVLAYFNGGVPGDYRLAEWWVSRAALTKTEILVHACRTNVEYGTPLA